MHICTQSSGNYNTSQYTVTDCTAASRCNGLRDLRSVVVGTKRVCGGIHCAQDEEENEEEIVDAIGVADVVMAYIVMAYRWPIELWLM